MAIAKTAVPAAKAVLRQATALKPQRGKASDGLLPSATHVATDKKAGIKSDHDTGYAADLTHDPINGFDGHDVYKHLQDDKRVKYLIFMGKIWSTEKGESRYTGPNPHNHHVHISIKDGSGDDTSPWFPWVGKPTLVNKVKSAIKPLPKKENK